MINTVLVGVGYWGSTLKRYLQEDPNFNLLFACDSTCKMDEIFHKPELKAVVVATPPETHYEIVKKALECGLHVLSEKPLAMTYKQCNELRFLSRMRCKVLLTDYVYNFSRALNIAKHLVENGFYGKLLAFDASVKHLGRFGKYNVHWLLSSHMLSVLGMFVHLPKLNFTFKDLIEGETSTILFNGKINGKIDVSINHPTKQVEVNLYCEEGTLIYKPHASPSLLGVKYEKPHWTPAKAIPTQTSKFPFDESNNLQFVFQHFCNLIEGKGKSNINLACEITRIIEENTT